MNDNNTTVTTVTIPEAAFALALSVAQTLGIHYGGSLGRDRGVASIEWESYDSDSDVHYVVVLSWQNPENLAVIIKVPDGHRADPDALNSILAQCKRVGVDCEIVNVPNL